MSGAEVSVRCCIAGGGPAGMMLGLLLARAGVAVLVLEKHADFLRDFRGDTVHPSTLEVFYELGLLDEFLSLPHQEVRHLHMEIGNQRFTIGDFTVDPQQHRVSVRGKSVRLTPKEFELIQYFASHPGRVLTHRAILTAVWDSNSVGQNEYLRVFIGNLRKKLEANARRPHYIKTEPWIGYRFDPE